jgi:hypothetical protein
MPPNGLDVWATAIRRRFPGLPTDPAAVLRRVTTLVGAPVAGADPSRPFSNGSDYLAFLGDWCETCAHYVPWHPEWDGDDPRLCPIETAMALAQADRTYWPSTAVREYTRQATPSGGRGWVCLAWEARTP